MKNQKDEIFEDDGDNDAKFNEMRETKTGFGAKGYQAEGGLEPDDEESDDDEEDDGEIGDDQEDDDDDASDHNF